jgi:pimeloyl-ACP methyl ester carboxylesterase
MTILEQMNGFAEQYGKQVVVDGTAWRYYRLGAGPPILWLTGGLRRAAFGFAFLERLAARHTVIAPDYPPVQTIGEFMCGFDAILQAEGVGTFMLGGQSYGGLLAQAYLAHRGRAVERLILSSSGPADLGRAWLPVEYAIIALLRLLPAKTAKRMFQGWLSGFITAPEGERAEWQEAINEVIEKDLSRGDVISHFAVAADWIRRGVVARAAFRDWTGRVIVLSAANDPTQSKKDFSRYERLFGRPAEVFDMGDMGHTAALFDPDQYVALLEQALA